MSAHNGTHLAANGDPQANGTGRGFDLAYALFLATIVFVLFPWGVVGPTLVGGGAFFEYRGVAYLLVLLTTLVFLSERETFDSKKTGVSIYVVALTVATVASVYRFANINATADFSILLCTAIAVGFLSVYYSYDERRRDVLVKLATLMVGALSAYGLVQYFVLYGMSESAAQAAGASLGVENRVSSVLTSPNAFASVCLFVWPLAFWLATRARSHVEKVVYWGNLGIILLALALTYSRAAYGVLLVQVAIAFMFLRRRDSWRARLVLAGGASVLAMSAAYLVFFRQRGAPTLASLVAAATGSFAGRLSIWETALRIVRDNPLTGTGAATFGSVYRAYQVDGFYSQQAHNVYLQTFAEVGVVGVVAFFGLALYVVLKCCVANKAVTTSKFIGFGALGMMLANMFESSVFVPLVAYLVALLTGVSFARVDTPMVKHRDFPRNAFIAGFIVLLAVVGFMNIGHYLAQAGRKLVYQGRDEGVYYLQLATIFNPVNAQYHSDLGQAYSAQVGSGANARVQRISEARRASFLEPFNPEYHADLAFFYLDEGQTNLAVYFLTKATEVAPLQPYYRFALGDVLLNASNVGAAQAEFERCVRLERYFRKDYIMQSYRPRGVPTNIDPLLSIARAYLRLGQIYLADGKHERSAQAFRRALAFNPNAVEALNGLTSVYLRSGEVELAEETIVRSLAVDSSLAESWYLYGAVLEKLGRVGDAKEAYARALNIDPHFALAEESLHRLEASGSQGGGRR